MEDRGNASSKDQEEGVTSLVRGLLHDCRLRSFTNRHFVDEFRQRVMIDADTSDGHVASDVV